MKFELYQQFRSYYNYNKDQMEGNFFDRQTNRNQCQQTLKVHHIVESKSKPNGNISYFIPYVDNEQLVQDQLCKSEKNDRINTKNKIGGKRKAAKIEGKKCEAFSKQELQMEAINEKDKGENSQKLFLTSSILSKTLFKSGKIGKKKLFQHSSLSNTSVKDLRNEFMKPKETQINVVIPSVNEQFDIIQAKFLQGMKIDFQLKYQNGCTIWVDGDKLRQVHPEELIKFYQKNISWQQEEKNF